jgi:menaquinone-dependent protoporphyrinogen IX oxidase
LGGKENTRVDGEGEEVNEVKTIIAYETKSGVTGESAKIIAGVLREKYGFEVDVVNLKDNPKPDLNQYQNIFIGSGIRVGRWYGRAKKLLNSDFTGKNFVVFVSACSAGDPKSHDAAVGKYLNDVLAKYPKVHPVATAAFGGRMKMLGKVQSDTCDPEKVRRWAEEVGAKLVK